MAGITQIDEGLFRLLLTLASKEQDSHADEAQTALDVEVARLEESTCSLMRRADELSLLTRSLLSLSKADGLAPAEKALATLAQYAVSGVSWQLLIQSRALEGAVHAVRIAAEALCTAESAGMAALQAQSLAVLQRGVGVLHAFAWQAPDAVVFAQGLLEKLVRRLPSILAPGVI